jgi:hypothetical protein
MNPNMLTLVLGYDRSARLWTFQRGRRAASTQASGSNVKGAHGPT